jgi:hypothetical protein
MNSIWLLQHVHKFEDGHECVKLIGAYTSEALAAEAKQRVLNQPGFRDLPEGFEISEVLLNRDGWVEGYDTYTYPL